MSTQSERTPIGIVLQDKAAGSREILVYPQDTLPFASGELKPVAQKVDISSKTSSGGSSVGSVTETNAIRAVYYGDQHSDMPPDVVKGEEVELIQDNDTGAILWKATGRTSKLRSRERKEMRSSNVDGYDKNIDDASSYFIRIDTLATKEIRIQTSMSDGELFGYTILLNPAASQIRVCDNENNEFGINSPEKQTYMRNKEGCIVSLIDKNAVVGAVEDLILKADRQIVMNTPNLSFINDSGDGCMVMNVKAMQINAQQFNIAAESGIGLHGPVEARSIVTGNIQAENYITGIY